MKIKLPPPPEDWKWLRKGTKLIHNDCLLYIDVETGHIFKGVQAKFGGVEPPISHAKSPWMNPLGLTIYAYARPLTPGAIEQQFSWPKGGAQ